MKNACIGLALAAIAAPSLAQDQAMVSAEDPEGLVAALDMAGYDPELGTDAAGDPKITLDIGGRSAGLFFYGCDETTNDGCDSVQFSIGFDRAKPWTADEAIQLSTRFRYAAVSLDDEGDPFLTWDVVTGEGIPTKVFLRSVLAFTSVVEDAENIIFAEERAEEGE
ncbi:YbjN domain-containing protein [Qipengyuania flava]|uniref:YbjN domain-containing protein n=1 Tax=Qipengyuania flava TaxID=192812 RepID=UPI001C62B9C3|nr:YbjN domain-containing protein [Qipengyuania flava]QYJ06294.1 YbjN domain-containing protein [Qipengyuania flava]